jgi:hypothetical protein
MGVLDHLRSYTVNGGENPAEPRERLASQQATGIANLNATRAANAHMNVQERPERTYGGGGVARDPNRLAQDNQVGLVYVLLGKLRTHNPCVERTARSWFDEARPTITASAISDVINRLRGHLAAPAELAESAPVVPTTPARAPFDAYDDIPDGNYALAGDGDTIHYYRVSRRTVGERTYTNVSERASDALYPVRPWTRARDILTAVRAAGPRDAAVLFGRTIGQCYRCGRSLTDADSRAAGIGPDCAGKGMF